MWQEVNDTVARFIVEPLERGGNTDRLFLQINIAPFKSAQFADAHARKQHKQYAEFAGIGIG